MDVANSKLSLNHSYFVNNQAHYSGGAIHLSKQSKLEMNAEITFKNNSATLSGGALSLRSSLLAIKSASTKIYFYNNTVNRTSGRGGAIFYRDDSYTFSCYSSYLSGQSCLIGFSDELNRKYLYLEHNMAHVGSIIYGGLLNRCKYTFNDSVLTGIEMLKQISSTSDFLNGSAISSDAVRVCHCVSMTPNCTHQPTAVTVWKGEIFYLSLATLDQNDNIVSSEVISGLDESSEGHIYYNEYTQMTSTFCTTISFHVYTTSRTERLFVYANGPCKDADNNLKVAVNINIRQECPVGFEGNSECVCDKRLQQFTNSCSIDNQTIEIYNLHYWLGFETTSFSYSYCPLDYCKTGRVVLTADDTDKQCAFNHSGKLCGNCKQNFSRTLGSSACIPCYSSKTYIWLTLLFIILSRHTVSCNNLMV